MAQAGFCTECKANVYLTPEGACVNGHGAECISGVYEVPEATTTPVAAQTVVASKKPLVRKWWFWAAAAIVLMGLFSALGSGNPDSTPSKPSASAKPPATTAAATTTPEPTAAPAPEATPAPEPAAAAPEAAAPEPAPAAPAPEPAPAAPAPKPSYKSLSARSFKLLAKNPDNYMGKTYVIYGEITQFDAATGADTFRADTGPKKLKPSYGFVNFSQNSILTGDESRLSRFVEGDLFMAKVTVLGSYSYDTQIGGNTTVPSFEIDSITRYGSLN
jgi:hypothetical protein